MKFVFTITIAGCLACPSFARQASEQPLPDFASLWSAGKPNLMQQYDDAELLKGYTYHRTSFVTQMGKGDSVTGRGKFEFEVYYLDSGPFNKLISRNGVKLSDKELKKQDEEFQKTRGKAPHRPPWRGGRRQRSPKEQENYSTMFTMRSTSRSPGNSRRAKHDSRRFQTASESKTEDHDRQILSHDGARHCLDR